MDEGILSVDGLVVASTGLDVRQVVVVVAMAIASASRPVILILILGVGTMNMVK